MTTQWISNQLADVVRGFPPNVKSMVSVSQNKDRRFQLTFGNSGGGFSFMATVNSKVIYFYKQFTTINFVDTA